MTKRFHACTDCKLNSIEYDILLKKYLASKGGEGDR